MSRLIFIRRVLKAKAQSHYTKSGVRSASSRIIVEATLLPGIWRRRWTTDGAFVSLRTIYEFGKHSPARRRTGAIRFHP